MTVQQLKAVMKYQLRNFNDEGVAITDTTVHADVLSDRDGFSAATSSKAVYRAFIRNTLARNGAGDPVWPREWLLLDVATLASALLGEAA